MSSVAEARAQRATAAARFTPSRIKLLLVAEAPPSSNDRYFYYPYVSTHDSLFRYVVRLVLGREATRENKPELLAALRDAGVYLMDASPDPVSALADLKPLLTDAVTRAADLKPDHIIILKVGVFDLLYSPMKKARLPVVNQRVAFPGSGQQRRFEVEMAAALSAVDWVCPA
jgi:hypothetical protein